MIDEIIKELVDIVEVYIKADMFEGKMLYHIYFTEKTSYHFDYIREVEAIARMNKYDLFINKDGFDLYPKGY